MAKAKAVPFGGYIDRPLGLRRSFLWVSLLLEPSAHMISRVVLTVNVDGMTRIARGAAARRSRFGSGTLSLMMTARFDTVAGATPRLSPWRWFVLAVPFLLLFGGCKADTPDAVWVAAAQTPAPASEAVRATTAPAETPAEPTSAPTLATVEPVGQSLACEDVPAFQAAETVSVACSGEFAVSPELFANNAGWHLFEVQDGAWIEIGYARTCCEPDDVSFVQLLGRNGLDSVMVAQLCAASGLASDAFSGCASDGLDEEDIAFDGAWLRVNGLGPHDFATGQDLVLSSIEQVFGSAESITEALECGAGPMTIVSFDDFAVQFQDNAFIGWYYVSSAPTLSTPSGVTVGISEADLVVAYEGVDIFDETLGREFFFEVPAGFMAGFISNTSARVTALHAGTNCFFR
jgi:hypothetical protein